LPAVVGAKLIGKTQEVPAARRPAVEDPLPVTAQAEGAFSSSVKFKEMLGLFPFAGIGKLRSALPTFSSVIVCGLSELVEPKGVSAKLKRGGSAASSFRIR
jgi:hypothetical protein